MPRTTTYYHGNCLAHTGNHTSPSTEPRSTLSAKDFGTRHNARSVKKEIVYITFASYSGFCRYLPLRIMQKTALTGKSPEHLYSQRSFHIFNNKKTLLMMAAKSRKVILYLERIPSIEPRWSSTRYPVTPLYTGVCCKLALRRRPACIMSHSSKTVKRAERKILLSRSRPTS